MKASAISWCDYSGGTLNFVSGCTAVSEGRANCYARAIYKRYGKDFNKVVCDEGKLLAAMKYHYRASDENPRKRGEGTRPICFVCDTGDLLHERVDMFIILGAFNEMKWRQDVDWVVLTKRPQRLIEIQQYIKNCNRPEDWQKHSICGAPNIWLGVTAENQARADERLPILLEHWAGPKFVSVEPMLEPVNLQGYTCDCGHVSYPALDWVICGAESGANRRPFDVEWARDLYRQCQMDRMPFYGKQDSGLHPGTPLLIDGKLIHEWPGVTR